MEENNVIETTAEVLESEPDLETEDEAMIDTYDETEDVFVMDTKNLAIKAGIAAAGGIAIGVIVKKVISPALKKLGRKVRTKIHEATAPKEDETIDITEEDEKIVNDSSLGKTMNTEESTEETEESTEETDEE